MIDTHQVKPKSEIFAPCAIDTILGLKSAGKSVKVIPLQERVRQRFQALVDKKAVRHDTLGKYLGLSRSAVTRLLNDEGSGFALAHVERLCEFFQVTPSEIMAETGARMVPIGPLEGQLLDTFRNMTELQRHSLLAILDRTAQQPSTKRRARLGRAELTEEQQLLVDLYARSPEQARSGILKTLKGTAKLGDAERGQHRTTE